MHILIEISQLRVKSEKIHRFYNKTYAYKMKLIIKLILQKIFNTTDNLFTLNSIFGKGYIYSN